MKRYLLGSVVPLPHVNLTHGNGTLGNKHLGNILSPRCPEKLCQLEGVENSENHGLMDNRGLFLL